MTNWLRKIMPKEEKFFPLFNDHADKIADGAEALRSVLSEHPSADADLDRILKDGGETSRRILDGIRGTFVTPFDRADIKEMTTSMQATLVEMAAVAKARRSPKLNGAASDLAPFGDLIADCARELKRGVKLLEEVDKHADDLRRMRDRIGAARERMSDLRDAATLGLFEHGGDDPIAALAGVRFLERIGSVVERFDAVADHIDDLVLDHV